MDSDQTTGLRERKKQQTRSALSSAALHLAVERGIENVRVEDIAAAAGVSPRTFNNYFSSKYEAICSRALDRAERVAEALRTRPAGEPLWEAIIATTVQQYEDGSELSMSVEWTAGVRTILSSPELQGEYLKLASHTERTLALAVAERTGIDAERDMYPRLVAAAVGAATYVATERWLHSKPPIPSMASLLHEALRQIAAGLPTP